MKVEVTIDTLYHDQELVEQGSILDLEDPQAEALIACGAVNAVGKDGSAKPSAKPPAPKKTR